MKRITMLAFLMLGFLVIPSLSQTETVLEHRLPVGWKLKDYSISQSNVKALFLFPDLSQDMLLTDNFPRRLQVFDESNNVLSDFIIDDSYRLLGITRSDKIIIYNGDEESCYRIKVLDVLGREYYTAETGGRWPSKALFGKDIALIPGHLTSGPISIIDEDTGREKASFGQLMSGDKAFPFAAFLPIGKDGFYVVGIGASLFLKSYLHTGEVYWTVQDLGGDIKDSLFLNDDLIAVSYGTDDFRGKKLMRGVVIFEWRTGNILFNKKAFQINGQMDSWYRKLHLLNLLTENGYLIFDGDPSDIVRLPRRSKQNEGWDEGLAKKIRLVSSQTERVRVGDKLVKPKIRQGKYALMNLGDLVRIERCQYQLPDTTRSTRKS
jgi:hypothetical protein